MMPESAARRWRLKLLAVGVFAGTVARAENPAPARWRALLVGVNRYPFLPARLNLDGPANDVALMRDALVARGVAPGDIHALVDSPTRAEILLAMSQLLASARPGDHLVLHLAGHGAQQPQPAGARLAEPDGLDEVFLPSDAQAWSGGTSTARIANAIVDDEIGDWIDAAVDRGAVVHAFFDCCHASGMARAGGAAGVRSVGASDLGLPPQRSAQRSGLPHFSGPRLDGRVLGYAARTHEVAREEWLPRAAPMSQARRHGVFSFHLAAALRAGVALSALPLGAALHAAYASEGRESPVPQVVGSGKA